MFKMFNNLFAMFASLFSAGNRLATAMDNAASFAEGESAHFAERTALVRQQEIKAMRAKYSLEDRKAAAEEARSIKELENVVNELSSDTDTTSKKKAA